MKGKISPRAAKSAHKAQLSDIQKALKAYYQKANVLFPGERRLQNGNNVIDLRLLPPNKANPQQDQIESSIVGGQPAEKVSLISLFARLNKKRVLVTGRAGIGKTILCDHLVNEWCDGSLLSNFQVVFRLRLKTLASKKPANLIDWIKSECFDPGTLIKYGISDDMIGEFVYKDKKNTLFILDGFDEALSLYNSDDPLKDILEEVLRLENVFVTTRPFCRAELMFYNFHRVLENVGFDDTALKEYLNTFEKNGKLNLWSVVQQQPVLKRICRIPLNAFLFASTWKKDNGNKGERNELTLTQLYQDFIVSIWKTRNEDDSVQDFEKLDNKCRHVFTQLAELAYGLSTNKKGKLIVPSEKLRRECDEPSLKTTGMLRYVDGGAMFMHKTFQEFFAAYHLYLELLRKPQKKKATHAIDFIRSNKYQSRYEMELTFLVGLVFCSTKKKPSKSLLRARNVLWDALFPIERDLVGLSHCQLLIRSLEESGRDDKVHIDELVEWLETSLSQDSLSQMLRQRLREAFELCPRTTQRVFQAYQDKLKVKDTAALWAKLTDNQRQALLQDYWLPLLSHFEDVPLFLIGLLADQKLPQAQLQMILNVDWREAKNSRHRQELSEQLSKQVMNLTGDQKLVCFQVWCALLTEEDIFAIAVIEDIEIKKKSDPLALCTLFATVVLHPEFQINALSLLCQQVIAEDEFSGMLLTYTRDWNGGKDLKVDAWLKCLSSKNDRLRDLAIRELSRLLQNKDDGYEELQTCLLNQATLGEIGERSLLWDERVGMLLGALNSSCSTIRSVAIEVAYRMGLRCPEPVVAKLCELLDAFQKSNKPYEFKKEPPNNLVDALAEVGVGDDRVIRKLLEMHKGTISYFRSNLVDALAKVGVGDARVISVLLDALENKFVRKKAVGALAKMGVVDDQVIPKLLVTLKDVKKSVRKKVVDALAEVGVGDARVIQALLDALKGPDYYVRRKVVNALARVGAGDDRVIPALLEVLQEDKKKDFRFEVIGALGKLGRSDARVIPALLKVCQNNNDSDIHSGIVISLVLSKARGEEAISALLGALNDSDTKVRSAAVVAFSAEAVGDERVITELLEVLHNDSDELVRCGVANALSMLRVGNERVITKLLEVLHNDRDERVRLCVACALGMMGVGGDRVIPVLLGALKGSDSVVRGFVVGALGNLGVGGDRVIPELLVALKDTDEKVRIKVVKALGNLEVGGDRVISELLVALKGANEKVRIEVVEALGKLGVGDDRVIKELLRLFQHEEDYSVLNTLGQVGVGNKSVIRKLLRVLKKGCGQLKQERIAKILLKVSTAVLPEIHEFLRWSMQEKSYKTNKSTVNDLITLLDEKARNELTLELLSKLKGADPEHRTGALLYLRILYKHFSMPAWLYSELKACYRLCEDDSQKADYIKLIGNPLLSIHYEGSKQCSQLAVRNVLDGLAKLNADVQSLYKQLEAYKQQEKEPHETFITYLVNAIDQLQIPPASAATICQTLNIKFAWLINAVTDKKREPSPIVFLALAEYWLLKGVDLQRKGRNALESTVLSERLTQREFFQPFLKALRKRMVAHGWPHRRIDAHLDSQMPRYFQQSRCVFYPPNDSLPLIPLITRNQAHVKRKSFSLQKKVSILFDFQAFDVDDHDQPYFAVQKEGDAMRVELTPNIPCFMLLRKSEGPPADLIPNIFYFSWEGVLPNSREYSCHIKCLTGEIKHFKVMPGKFLDWIRKESELKAMAKSITPEKSLQNDFLTAHDIAPPTTKAIMESIIGMVVEKGCRMLDLSGNNLDDVAIRPLIKSLLKYNKLKVLKLSNNHITVNGLDRLIKSLEKSPSVKYLLLDHNLIHFGGVDYGNVLGSEELPRIKGAGLIHLDLSMNFIPEGELIDGKWLHDSSSMKKLGKRPQSSRERIMRDLIVHSSFEKPLASIIAPNCSGDLKLLNDVNARVGLFSTRIKPGSEIGTHSYLLIERIIPGFGQRQLIKADLMLNKKGGGVDIMVGVITPEAFYKKFVGDDHEKVFWRTRLVSTKQCEKLLKTIYESRNKGDFNEYAPLGSDKGHVESCHTWAIKILIKAEIIEESHREGKYSLILEKNKVTMQVVRDGLGMIVDKVKPKLGSNSEAKNTF